MTRLAPLEGISSKAMFGGYGIFHQGAMFALISGDGLFFKVDDANKAEYLAAGSSQYKPMPYYRVPPAVFKDTKQLLAWADKSIRIAHAGPAKKKAKG